MQGGGVAGEERPERIAMPLISEELGGNMISWTGTTRCRQSPPLLRQEDEEWPQERAKITRRRVRKERKKLTNVKSAVWAPKQLVHKTTLNDLLF